MDFFKSVFSGDPDPSGDPPRRSHDAEGEAAEEALAGEGGEEERGGGDPGSPNPSSPGGGGGGWSFGGLIKTFASKSESVIQTYRRDLEEFGSGLKKETVSIREVATRAVRDLPVSLEVGASVAQESLESVGQAIDDFGGSVWRGTSDIISQGKDAILSMDSDAAASDDPNAPSDTHGQNPGSSKRYSRFEIQVLGIQSDPNTFSAEPEDAEDFQMWKSGFQLTDKEEEEIEGLCAENEALESNLEKLVPEVVDCETFWSRYFYKVHKLKLAEDARANLVKRVIYREQEEEELSWEVEDDEEEQEERKEEEENEGEKEGREIEASELKKEINKSSEPTVEPVEKSQVENVAEAVLTVSDENVTLEGKLGISKSSDDESAAKSGDKILPEVRAEPGESSKDSDVSVVSSQPSMQEEDDLGWDEIEDLGDNDDKKLSVSAGSPSKLDLRKRLSAAEEDEDLSWDIEDDDPIKP